MSTVTNDFLLCSRPSLVPKGRIRPLVESDLSQIRNLRQKIGGRDVPNSPSSLKRFFFDSPWSESEVCSLAYEDRNGRVVGCLGITARPMVFRERSIRAVVGHHLMVDPSRAGTRAGIELARRFMGGPQDLSLAVWNDFGRRIWTSLGGTVSSLHSLSWTRALRPARYILSMLKNRGLASAAVTLAPGCQAFDVTLGMFGTAAVPQRDSEALSDDLDAVTMLSYLSAFISDRTLKPRYDVPSLTWLLETLDDASHRGHLHKVAVRTPGGRPLGWYVYHLGPSGAAEVLQIGGKHDALRSVLSHLFHHARQRGAVEVTGPMDARLVGPLSEQHCAFHRPRNTWALIHSRDARIGDAIHSGDAFLSKLEGAPWLEIEE